MFLPTIVVDRWSFLQWSSLIVDRFSNDHRWSLIGSPNNRRWSSISSPSSSLIVDRWSFLQRSALIVDRFYQVWSSLIVDRFSNGHRWSFLQRLSFILVSPTVNVKPTIRNWASLSIRIFDSTNRFNNRFKSSFRIESSIRFEARPHTCALVTIGLSDVESSTTVIHVHVGAPSGKTKSRNAKNQTRFTSFQSQHGHWHRRFIVAAL